MRVTCVIDDTDQPNSPFQSEHGLAFLIEAESRRVLFDTGQSGSVLLHNLDLLGVEPATIDAVAISHAHYDHTGGLPALLEFLRPGIPLYAHSDLFRGRYTERDGQTKSVGIASDLEELAARLALELNAVPQGIIPGLWTTGEISQRPEPLGSSDHHRMRQGDDLVADAYRDDMSLVLHLDDALLLLCGCCHAGLLNTIAHVQRTFERPIAAIAGGLHLISTSAEELQRIGALLAAMPQLRRVYPSHCTGEKAFAALVDKLGPDVVRPCRAGTVLDLAV
ncbi:MAG: MBL fold metallo-hydrolase [Anaerolineae bacterium]|jgi:7,8-dihydropterin-6-yl-methyl-4-(beta-D-ribofuranosyl)aminobenzene 5'-phosphate synthase